MDAFLLTIEMLSLPEVTDFFLENLPNVLYLRKYLSLMRLLNYKSTFSLHELDNNQYLIERVRLTAHKVGKFVSEIVERKAGDSYPSSGSESHDLLKDWEDIVNLISDYPLCHNREISHDDTKRIENLLLETEDYSTCQTLGWWLSELLLVKKVIPAAEHIPNELGDLPLKICKACRRRPLALLLIGGLLSFKPIAYDTWYKVTDDLMRGLQDMMHIINYCYDDLPYFLKMCFLYFACYPIGYEISATSLTNIWIAEGFIAQEKEEMRDETANIYLEQLVQRSLVFVSKRSLLGTIKSCRVPRVIHEFAVQKSHKDEFLVANPDQEKIESLFRLAIHHDDKNQYTEMKNNRIHSILAFNIDRNILRSAILLRVLELRNSAIPETALPNMIYLKYLGLRGGNISKLPQNIGDMKYLQTLDVRDTSIETLPESIWNIKTLRHVYVKPSHQIKGPPSTALIDSLHTLKTVATHGSWVENIPHFLIHLRKLALLNMGILTWKSISNLLSRMDKLISMVIMGGIIPSEAVDIRAFPNLETVKSIKLEGKWNCRKLIIDNVKFPPNLAKLTLSNSGLKEDPMPTLERLQALKFLSLKDGAYIGKKMICSANGFPHLQFLELDKLENLQNWKVELVMDGSVKKMGLPQLTTLRVVQCRKLNNLPNLDHVSDKFID